MARFSELLQKQWQQGRLLCVGLDSDYQRLPEVIKSASVTESLFNFNRAIIEATADYCGFFKPNSAYYEAYGPAGIEALIQTNRFIRESYPDHLIILDAKRADIGSTNQGYAKYAFEVCAAHAVTVHPYLGKQALQPFLDDPDHGIFVLCHTSNPGAGEFQELKLEGRELYKILAQRVSQDWNSNGNCGLVVGATYPAELAEVRRIAGELPLLIPGIGAQGGDLETTVRNGVNAAANGIIINASRSISYASSGPDFSSAAAAEAGRLDRAIREVLKSD